MPVDNPPHLTEHGQLQAAVARLQPPPEDSEFDQWIDNQSLAASDESDEIERYLRLPKAAKGIDPISWWLGQRNTFPRLSKLALDIFAIPAMAADCERAFSLAKLTLTSQRLSMSPEVLEAVQCLKNWLRRGAIRVGAQLGTGLIGKGSS